MAKYNALEPSKETQKGTSKKSDIVKWVRKQILPTILTVILAQASINYFYKNAKYTQQGKVIYETTMNGTCSNYETKEIEKSKRFNFYLIESDGRGAPFKGELRNTKKLAFVYTNGEFDPFNEGDQVHVTMGRNGTGLDAVLDSMKSQMIKNKQEEIASKNLPTISCPILAYHKLK